MAGTKKEASAAFDLFNETCGVKYEKAVGKLVKDRDELLAFHGLRPFPPQTVPGRFAASRIGAHSRPNTGSMSGPRTRSGVSSPRSATARGKPRAARTAKPPSPRSSG